MYYLDRDAGRRRRARIRDRSTHLLHELNEGVDRTRRDVQHRTTGLVQRTRARLSHEPVSDHVLHERVRAAIGRCVSHPRSIEVAVDGGRVTLRGPILQREVAGLLRCVEGVAGVQGVIPQLEPHKSAENVPGLQGTPSRPRRGRRPDVLQDSWSPSTRVLSTLLGVGSGLRARKHGVLGPLYGVLGTGLALRGLTNLPLARMFGLRGGRRAFELQKTMTVRAPVAEVFRFWSNIENFPRFMQHIKRVHRIDEARSRWTVEGPAGTDVEWEAETTRVVPNEVLAWKTLPGAHVEHAGTIQFEPANGGSATRLQIRLAYKPPVGAIGHAIAKLFGKDPKTAMDEDLVRMKSLLERGKTAAHGQTVTREQLSASRT